MRKYILTVIISLLFFACSSSKQSLRTNQIFKKVDYNEIGRTIKDTNSKFYYPILFRRFNDFDTSLTNDEYFYLFYGYTCQDNYYPYPYSSYDKEYRKWVTAANGPGVDDSIMKYSSLILKDIPFYLKHYSMLSYLYNNLGNVEKSKKISIIIRGLLDAIMSTGDGLSEETAIHVIYTSNEYDLIRFIGFEFGGDQSLTKKGCDYLILKSNSEDIDGLYFNVIRLFQVNRLRREK